MKTNNIPTIFLGLVLITGMFSFGLMSSDYFGAFAEKGGNDKAKGVPQGCDNDKGKDKSNNPNCNSEPDSDGDGIPDSLDICPGGASGGFAVTVDDQDGDGTLNGNEVDLDAICDPSR